MPTTREQALEELNHMCGEVAAYAQLHRLQVVVVHQVKHADSHAHRLRKYSDAKFDGLVMRCLSVHSPVGRDFYRWLDKQSRASAWRRFCNWLPWNRDHHMAGLVVYEAPP